MLDRRDSAATIMPDNSCMGNIPMVEGMRSRRKDLEDA